MRGFSNEKKEKRARIRLRKSSRFAKGRRANRMPEGPIWLAPPAAAVWRRMARIQASNYPPLLHTRSSPSHFTLPCCAAIRGFRLSLTMSSASCSVFRIQPYVTCSRSSFPTVGAISSRHWRVRGAMNGYPHVRKRRRGECVESRRHGVDSIHQPIRRNVGQPYPEGVVVV